MSLVKTVILGMVGLAVLFAFTGGLFWAAGWLFDNDNSGKFTRPKLVWAVGVLLALLASWMMGMGILEKLSQ